MIEFNSVAKAIRECPDDEVEDLEELVQNTLRQAIVEAFPEAEEGDLLRKQTLAVTAFALGQVVAARRFQKVLDDAGLDIQLEIGVGIR